MHHAHLTAIAWGSLVLLAVSKPALAAWMPDGIPVCRSPGGQVDAVVATDGAGGVFVAWEDNRSQRYDDTDIYVQHITPQGDVDAGWPENGFGVSTASSRQFRPSMVPDGTGGAILMWGDTRTYGYLIEIYAQRITRTGQIADGWIANGVPFVPASSSPYLLDVVPDGAGGALFAWRGARNNGTTDLYVLRIAGDGNLAPGWKAPGPAMFTATNQAYFGDLLPDGVGGAFVVTVVYPNVGDSNLLAYHVTADGRLDPDWPAEGFPVCMARNLQLRPTLTSDGDGGFFVAWDDLRSNRNYDIYVQRITPNGQIAPDWARDGIVVCDAYRRQVEARIVGDGSGGAIVSWRDIRDGVHEILYAQRITASGRVAPGWVANGLALSTAPRTQAPHLMIADGDGGAIAAWVDAPLGGDAGQRDLFVQRVASDGSVATGWRRDGVALCTAPGAQVFPSMATDGAGGAIVAWTDGRQGPSIYDPDIYAQHVGAAGDVIVPVEVQDLLATPGDHEVLLTWSLSDAARRDVVQVMVQRSLERDGPFSVQSTMALAAAPRMSFADRNVEMGTTYWYRLELRLLDGAEVVTRAVVVTTRTEVLRTAVVAAYERPGGESIEIRFTVGPRAARLQLGIYDLHGRCVRVLLHQTRASGSYVEAWDRRNTAGARAARGLYFVRLVCGTEQAARKLLLFND